MSQESIDFLKKSILDSTSMLEYGAGESTIFALENDKQIVSVETDEKYINGIKSFDSKSLLTPLHVNVGKTKEWGYSEKLDTKRNWFKEYAELPWETNKSYDFIFIDGRFRVLSFISSWNNAKIGTKILWDDFKDRDYYKGILPYVPAPKMIGRIASWEKTESHVIPKIFIVNHMYDER